jgi:hypothetical protein
MTLYHVAKEKLEAVPTKTFAEERILERKDLQRLLKADISPLGDDLMVIAEEFGDWDESNRRIDLLCLDKQARLVVVEIKRTEDGGHMDLQAIRYAAMVSSMTLEQAIAAHARMLGGEDAEQHAQKEILEFLELDSVEEAELTDEVRIVLVSANFSPEIATSVLWLNRHELDIVCIRFIPYKKGEDLFIDVTQIIPLPEASEYEIKIKAKDKEIRKVKTGRQEILRRFWFQFIEKARLKTNLYANRSTTVDHWLSAGIGRAGFRLHVSLAEDQTRVECYIRIGKDNDKKNTTAFEWLKQQREQIEHVFEDTLEWQELSNRSGCRICKMLDGGWHTPEGEWPVFQDKIIDAVMRLEKALKGPIQTMKL